MAWKPMILQVQHNLCVLLIVAFSNLFQSLPSSSYDSRLYVEDALEVLLLVAAFSHLRIAGLRHLPLNVA